MIFKSWGINHLRSVFFSREHRKSAREQFRESVREHFASSRERLNWILPVNPKSAREQSKKCPWNSNLPVNIFKKKCPWTYENCPWTSKFCVFLLLFVKKCPWTAKSARENFQKSARERILKCPWKRPKKYPWTHPLTREFSPRSASEPKKVPVNIFQKMGFTGTFDVHGKKKTLAHEPQCWKWC